MEELQTQGDQRIRELATCFRDAIVETDLSAYPGLREFPKGSCGDASLLLGEFLYQNGEGTWQYIGEGHKGRQYHAWLEKDGLILDITADQFDGISEPVIVTRDRTMYEQFADGSTRKDARLDIYDERTTTMLRSAYEEIGKNLVPLS